MLALLRHAWRDVTQRPLRALLTVLGIVVGVAGVVAITSTSANIVAAQRALVASTSQADLSYWVWDAPPSLIPLLEADPRIAAAELRLSTTTRWRVGETWMDIELVGIEDWGAVRVNQFEIVAGYAPGAGQILLDISAARAADLAPGAEIVYRDPQRRERYATLSGLSRSPSHLSSAITKVALGYLPAGAMRRMLNVAGSNQLLIKLRDPQDLQAVAERVSRLLRRQGVQAGAPELRDPQHYPGKRELDALILVMFIFSALGLLLSLLLVANTLSANVAAQVREIGTLKALGAVRGQILLLYGLEALLYGLAGTALGLGVGSLAGWWLLA
jgi:putative ABC transport system permease protein